MRHRTITEYAEGHYTARCQACPFTLALRNSADAQAYANAHERTGFEFAQELRPFLKTA